MAIVAHVSPPAPRASDVPHPATPGTDSPLHRAAPLRPSGARYGLLVLGYLVGYVALDATSLLAPAPAGAFAASPWSPAAGASLALLLRCGLRNAPWLVVASLVSEFVWRGTTPPLAVLVAEGLLPALVYTALAWLLRAPLAIDVDLRAVRDFALLLVAATIVTGLLAGARLAVALVAGAVPGENVGRLAFALWASDLIGIAVVAPLLLVLTRRDGLRVPAGRSESVALLALLAVTLGLVLAGDPAIEPRPLYVVFVPLLWLTVRHGLEAATWGVATAMIGLTAALAMAEPHAAAMAEAQLFLLTLAVTALPAGAAISRRRDEVRAWRQGQAEHDRAIRRAGAAEMATTLAHDLEPALAAARKHWQVAHARLPKDSTATLPLRNALGGVAIGLARASEAMRELSGYSAAAVSPMALDVEHLLQGVLEASRERLERLGVHTALDVAPGFAPVLADPSRVSGVLQQLIDRAIDAVAAMPPDQREIALLAAMADEGLVRIAVADSGTAISEEEAATLFHPSAGHGAPGAGLDLAMSRATIEACGGTLWLERMDAGSTFVFTLPV